MRPFPSGSVRALLLLAFCLACVASTSAQRRDFLTDGEIEIIREAQDIDVRIDALTKMADRRFAVLGIDVNGWKESEKNTKVWGVTPTGTRTQLLNDIKKILQKAVDDIDNLAANPSAAPIREKDDKRATKDPERFPNAVRGLASAAQRYFEPLKAELGRSTIEEEKGLIISSLELCTDIMNAVGKLPSEVKKAKS